jgi:hypothetical protein
VCVCVCVCVCFPRKLSMNLLSIRSPWYFRVRGNPSSVCYQCISNRYSIPCVSRLGHIFFLSLQRIHNRSRLPSACGVLTSLTNQATLTRLNPFLKLISLSLSLSLSLSHTHTHTHLYHSHEAAGCHVTHKPAYIAVMATWVWRRRLSPKG